MTVANMYIPQVFAMVLASYITALFILISRVVDLIKNRRTLSFYEDFDSNQAPMFVVRPTRQLANQFEFPVLFYAAMAVAIAIPLNDPLVAGLAWGYVVLRWSHMISHLAFNRLYVRTPVFMIGNIMLLALWVVIVFRISV